MPSHHPLLDRTAPSKCTDAHSHTHSAWCLQTMPQPCACCSQSPGSILGLTSTGSESFDEASVHDDPQPEAAADSSTRRFARHPLGDGPEASGMSATVRAVAAACGAVGITHRVTAGGCGPVYVAKHCCVVEACGQGAYFVSYEPSQLRMCAFGQLGDRQQICSHEVADARQHATPLSSPAASCSPGSGVCMYVNSVHKST